MKRNFIIALTALIMGATGAPADTHRQTGTLGSSKETKATELTNFCINADGEIVACDGASKCVRVITPDDKLKATWKLPYAPEGVAMRPDGSCVVAGPGKVAILDASGAIVKSADVPTPHNSEHSPGVAILGDDIFVCARANTGFSIFRFDKELSQAKEIVSGLRGCCGCLDIQSDGKALYACENAFHHVIRYDRDGKKLSVFGKNDPKTLEGFGGCCEPKNICFGANGDIYTSESANCRIKKYSADGTCTLVAMVKSKQDCLQVTIGLSKDGSKLYFLDSGENNIRVLSPVAPAAAAR